MSLQSIIDQALGHLTSIATNLLNVGLATVLTSIQGKRDIMAQFQEILNQALGHVTVIATNLANTGLAALLAGLQGKRGIFDDLLGQLSGAINTIGSSLGQVGSQLLTAVTPHLQDLQDQLTNHALNAASSLLGTLANISGTLQG